MSKMLHDDILECLPRMRRFARRLTRDHTSADDLVQTAVMRALLYAEKFKSGTNFEAWIITILRNSHFTEVRRRVRHATVALDIEVVACSTRGGQEASLELRDFHRAYQHLTPEKQRALILIGAEGMSYDEAAGAAGCAAGTMKSRVSRARLQLRELLDDGPASRPLPIALMMPRVSHGSVALRARIGTTPVRSLAQESWHGATAS